jgi:hypothetical protein
LGFLWIVSPAVVFLAGSAMAVCSLVLALLIPRHPTPDHPTILAGLRPLAGPAA